MKLASMFKMIAKAAAGACLIAAATAPAGAQEISISLSGGGEQQQP